MSQGKITSSLLPEVIRREKMWREKTKWFAAAAALFVVAAAVPYGRFYFERWQFEQQTAIQGQNQKVFGDASKLDTDWSNIENSGGPDRTRISNVKSLVTYRDLWPKLFTDIVKALPQYATDAPKELQSSDPNEIKKIPRAQRKQIIIEKVVSRYAPDLTAVLAAPSLSVFANEQVDAAVDMGASAAGAFGGPQPVPFGVPDGGTPDGSQPPGAEIPTGGPANANAQRGFVITIKCTTPFAGGVALVDSSFIPALMKLVPGTLPPGKPYGVVKAAVARKMLVREDSQRMTKMQQDYQTKLQMQQNAANQAAAGVPGMPGPVPGSTPPPPVPDFNPVAVPGMGNAGNPNAFPDAAFQDAILKEDVRDDTECTMVFVVVLDPPPAAPPPAAPAAPAKVAVAK
jgi:hypothetical protein